MSAGKDDRRLRVLHLATPPLRKRTRITLFDQGSYASLARQQLNRSVNRSFDCHQTISRLNNDLSKGVTHMLRLAILDQDSRPVAMEDVRTAAELLALVDQARNVIRDCERRAHQMGAKSSDSQPSRAPYMT